MPSKLDTMTRILLALTILMTVLIGAVIYMVLFSPADPRPARARAAAAGEPPAKSGAIRCDAFDLDASACPDGFYCQFDTCVPVVENATCDEGESCRDCDCAEGLVCHQNRCFAADRVDRAPLICEKDARLAEAVKILADKCTKRKKNVDEIVSAGACTTQDWEQLALEDEKFDLLLSAFPNRFAVHFPSGQPHLKRQDWPSETTRSHYLGQIHKYRQALSEAKQIFVIGRASPDGKRETNNLLALRRMALVSDLVETVIFGDIPLTKRRRIPIRSFTLPTSNPIDPGRYRKTYLQSPEGALALALDPLITWDDQSHGEMQAALDDQALLEKGSGRTWQELFGKVNRVVLVIPIPCTGDEYRPPTTDVPREPAGGPAV